MKISEFFFSENFRFLAVKFSVYLNRHVFVMLAGPPLRMILLSGNIYVNQDRIITIYESTPIQKYRKFHLQKLKIFRLKTLIFFIFLLKTLIEGIR